MAGKEPTTAKDNGKAKRIEHASEMPRYAPPGHSVTSVARLVDRDFAGNYELRPGTVEPGGTRSAIATAGNPR